jgi:cadmium resistance protein CadD (predicted permease)
VRGLEAGGDANGANHGSRVVTAVSLTFANGGDNVSLYIPLFAIHTLP